MERMVQFLFADAAMMFVVDVLLLGFSCADELMSHKKLQRTTGIHCEKSTETTKIIKSRFKSTVYNRINQFLQTY